MQEEKNYHPSLTGIRAIAAWLVFVHHFNFFKEAIFGKAVYRFFSETHIGVTVFFVLSGLLITLRYYDRAINSGNSFYNYMVKRFARIFPPFFLILTMNFVWLLATHVYNNSFDGGWKQYLGCVSLLRGFFLQFAPDLVPQSWSLTAEECFYISCPLIYYLLRKNIKAMIVIPTMLIAIGLLITSYFVRHPFHGFFADYRFLFNFTFFGRCIEFFAGIGLALLYKKKMPQKTNAAKFTVIGIFVMTACLAGLSFLHTDEFYGDHHPIGIVINNLVLPIAGISVLFWGLLTEDNFITKILASKWMVLFGKSSYIFYLVHLGFFASIFYNGITHTPLLLFIYLNIVSVLLYLGFERPVNVRLRKMLLRPEATSVSKSEK